MVYCPPLADGLLRPGRHAGPVTSMTQDAEELSSLRRLDPLALSSIHDRYFPEVYRYAAYRVGDALVAEDVASEAFVRLLEALQTGRGPRTSVRRWLIGTANHLVLDHFRAVYQRPQQRLSENAAGEEGDPVVQLETGEKRMGLRRALEALTAEQQHVLALRFGGGYSLEETAGLMGKNANAIKALQFRALAALRRTMGDSSP
jgi:RNA polymerase sigma-70 factor (ECF subfamily)